MDHIESTSAAATAEQSTGTEPPLPALNQVTDEDFTAMNLEIINNTTQENDGNTPVEYFKSPETVYPGDKPEFFYGRNGQTTKEFDANVQKTYFGQGGENEETNGQENTNQNTTGGQNDSTDTPTTGKKKRGAKGTGAKRQKNR